MAAISRRPRLPLYAALTVSLVLAACSLVKPVQAPEDKQERALHLARAGYEPPVMRTDIPAPGENILAALKMGAHLMRQGEYISDHEQKLATKIAEVLCGGNITPGTPVSEQYLLDLEREAFKSLCGEKKTQERIQFTLKTGKTLRN